MNIARGQKASLEKAEALVVPIFDTTDLAPIVDRYPEAEFFLRRYKFKGKSGEEVSFNSADKKKLIAIVGAGKPDNLADTISCSRKTISILNRNKINKAAIHFLQDLDKEGVKQRFWVNFIDYLYINHYSFDTYKTNKNEKEKLNKISLCFNEPNPSTYLPNSFLRERETIVEVVNRARDLVNETPARANPDYIVEEFERVAAVCELDLLVLREKELLDRGLNGIIAVGKASPYESALIRLSYIPDESLASIALVGKGITFDSGGLDLKPRYSMTGMKCDMSGAAAVLAVIEIAAKLKLPFILDAYAPVAENMPGQFAFKPGDIITFSNNKTVEIVDTDAEGRLLLADTLIMAAEEKPDYIIELSTLTGSMANFFGDRIAGLMGTDENLSAMLMDAARDTGENLWQLPLLEEYKESIQSKVADFKNASYGRAPAIKAGLFLNEFTQNIPFAHIDIAGTAYLAKSNGFYSSCGATGFGVRLLIDFLQSLEKNKKKFDKNAF